MRNHEQATYVEGAILGGGWNYRINRVEKSSGEAIYAVLLTYEDYSKKRDKLYLWLAEFRTIDQARIAANDAKAQWHDMPHQATEPEGKRYPSAPA